MSLEPQHGGTGTTTPTVVNSDDGTARLQAWLAGNPLPPAPTSPPPAATFSGRVARPAVHGATAYGAAALAGEIDEVAATGSGGRNHALNLAAYKLAGYIPTGDLTTEAITDGLYNAAVSCGLVRDDGERSVRNTIRSGLSAGATAPRAKGDLQQPAPPPVLVLPPPSAAAVPAAGEQHATPAAEQGQAPAADQTPTPAPAPPEKPQIDVTGGGPAAIRALHAAIEAGALPDLYVTNGQVVHLEKVSGDVAASMAAGATSPPLPVATAPLGPDGLAYLLARDTYTYRTTVDKEGKVRVEETVPAARLLAATLSGRHWPAVRPLHGIIGAPALRPDGSLLQTPGYDKTTGLWLAPKTDHIPVPTPPGAGAVIDARAYLLDVLLSGFPWVADADRANFIALLVSPILRPYLRTLTPFGMVTATTASSGKSLLTELLGQLYGLRTQAWPRSDDAELRKAITAVLTEPAPVIVWDNLREGSVLDAPVLAQLITSPVWSDRQLGTNKTLSLPNDRLWLATGNNLRLGGDMASRTVLVRLDPKMPHPEERTGFVIADLDQWIRDPTSQRTVLRHLLVLVADWVAAGAPRDTGKVMRQFTPWARGIGGFLAHHGLEGFLGNVDAIRTMDDDDNEWAIFLGKWHEIYGDKPMTAAELRRSADTDFTPMTGVVDRWDGTFLADGRTGLPANAKALGRRLGGQVGRFHGPYVLHRRVDPHTKSSWWSVHQPPSQ